MFLFKLSVRSFMEHPENSPHLPVFTLAADLSRQLEDQEPKLQDRSADNGERIKSSGWTERNRAVSFPLSPSQI